MYRDSRKKPAAKQRAEGRRELTKSKFSLAVIFTSIIVLFKRLLRLVCSKKIKHLPVKSIDPPQPKCEETIPDNRNGDVKSTEKNESGSSCSPTEEGDFIEKRDEAAQIEAFVDKGMSTVLRMIQIIEDSPQNINQLPMWTFLLKKFETMKNEAGFLERQFASYASAIVDNKSSKSFNDDDHMKRLDVLDRMWNAIKLKIKGIELVVDNINALDLETIDRHPESQDVDSNFKLALKLGNMLKDEIDKFSEKL